MGVVSYCVVDCYCVVDYYFYDIIVYVDVAVSVVQATPHSFKTTKLPILCVYQATELAKQCSLTSYSTMVCHVLLLDGILLALQISKSAILLVS